MMTMQLELLTGCALAGCAQPVAEPGDVCEGCIRVCGPFLVRCETRPGVAREQIEPASADASAADSAAQWLAKRHIENRVSLRPQIAEVIEAVEVRKANQLCWLCEQRRACTHIAGRWECDECQGIR